MKKLIYNSVVEGDRKITQNYERNLIRDTKRVAKEG